MIDKDKQSAFVTPNELQDRWKISRGKAYGLADVLPTFRIGGNVRYTLEGVEKYEREHTHRAYRGGETAK